MESRCVIPIALCILLEFRPVCHVPLKIKIRFQPNIHTTNQGAALMMSCLVSEGVYLMQRPVSSTYKYADRIMDYAKPAGLLGGHKTCSTFHLDFLFFSFSCASSAACFSHHLPGLSLFNTLMWYHVIPCDTFRSTSSSTPQQVPCRFGSDRYSFYKCWGAQNDL